MRHDGLDIYILLIYTFEWWWNGNILEKTTSISWRLMPWFLAPWGHQPEQTEYLTIQNNWIHDDVIKWKQSQWRGTLMFSLICALNKRLSKQSWGWWFETPSCSLWRHCNAIVFHWEVFELSTPSQFENYVFRKISSVRQGLNITGILFKRRSPRR